MVLTQLGNKKETKTMKVFLFYCKFSFCRYSLTDIHSKEASFYFGKLSMQLHGNSGSFVCFKAFFQLPHLNFNKCCILNISSSLLHTAG